MNYHKKITENCFIKRKTVNKLVRNLKKSIFIVNMINSFRNCKLFPLILLLPTIQTRPTYRKNSVSEVEFSVRWKCVLIFFRTSFSAKSCKIIGKYHGFSCKLGQVLPLSFAPKEVAKSPLVSKVLKTTWWARRIFLHFAGDRCNLAVINITTVALPGIYFLQRETKTIGIALQTIARAK